MEELIKWIKANFVWFVLPYLFFVSFLYHVGYWNPFNIDILNYFEFQDAINGILFPIVENLKLIVLIIILMAFVVLSKLLYGFLRNRIKLFLTILVFIPIIIGALFVVKYLTFEIYPNLEFRHLLNIVILFGVFLVGAEALKISFWDDNFSKSHFNKLFILIAIPIYTFILGYNNALDVLKGYQYQYIETSLLTNKEGLEGYHHLIYLGKGGDTYLLYHSGVSM